MPAVKPIPDRYRTVTPPIEDVSPDEIARRMAAINAGPTPRGQMP